MSQPGQESRLAPPRIKEFVFGVWTVKVVHGHIMGSQCEATTPCDTQSNQLCNFCRYGRELQLPSLPDMVFADNLIELRHQNGGSMTFTALDALRGVNSRQSSVQVAHAQVWKEARADCESVNKVVEPYDWTYTTTYHGSLSGPLNASPSEERIDLEQLKVREEIKFYAEVYLYEDELDDNGCTRCVVKVRVMPSGIFLVFRQYLRVDQVIVRINDTRIYGPAGTDHLLRETSSREAAVAELRVPPIIYHNPDVAWQHLPIVTENVDKITPVSSTNST